MPALMKIFVRAAEDQKVVSKKENLINEAPSGAAPAAAASEEPEPAIVHAQEPRDDVSTGSSPPQLHHAEAGRLSVGASRLDEARAPTRRRQAAMSEGDEAYADWNIDLWEQHGVLSPLMQQQLRGWPSTTLFWCGKCYENVTNWLDIGDHVRSKKHRHAMANAAESSKVPELAIEHASEPREDVNVARWASHLPHAETDKVKAASSEPLGGVKSNLRHAGGARLGDRFDQNLETFGVVHSRGGEGS